MIRFIDLRGQGTGYRFGWWDTGVHRFLEFEYQQTWDKWSDFEEDYKKIGGPQHGRSLKRFRSLCPDWVDTEPTGREQFFDEPEYD